MYHIVGNGIDFNSNTINVDFQRRTVMQNVSIPIVNDDTVEIIENFSLSFRILNRFLNVGVRQGIPATATVFIIDDDGMWHIHMCACTVNVDI